MLYFRSMNNENINANDHSKNERSAEKSLEGKTEYNNFIKAIQGTIGERNHIRGYSLDLIAKFFRNSYNFEKFVISSKEEESIQVNELFERVTDSLDFNVYLQRKVATHLKGKFTSDELACIFQAHNGTWIQYENKPAFIKERLYDFIDHEGKALYNIADVDAFKAKIKSMNPFEFEIFVNLILEVWGIEGNMIGRLHDFLLSDSPNKFPESH